MMSDVFFCSILLLSIFIEAAESQSQLVFCNRLYHSCTSFVLLVILVMALSVPQGLLTHFSFSCRCQ